jgi:hypothetical protein
MTTPFTRCIHSIFAALVRASIQLQKCIRQSGHVGHNYRALQYFAVIIELDKSLKVQTVTNSKYWWLLVPRLNIFNLTTMPGNQKTFC